RRPPSFSFFFFNDTATTEIYTLSLHDALPIRTTTRCRCSTTCWGNTHSAARSEEHTCELQSHLNLVCRLLLEKKTKSKSSKTNSTAKRAHLTSPLYVELE